MHDRHLRAIDLNLLPVLDALIRHRSVTTAAAAVNLSQPAASRALARLRGLLGDPILVRGPRGYVLTARAESLRAPLDALLREVAAMLREPVLDPARENRTVTIAMTDSQAVMLMPPLLRRLARVAPGISIVAVPISADIADRITTGRIDMVIALATTPLPPGAASVMLARDRLVIVTAKSHPRAGKPWRFADYARWPSIAISLVGDGNSDLDAILAREGIVRRFAAVTPNFLAALAIVGQTDAVTTVSAALASHFAETFGLALGPVPFTADELPMTIVMAQPRASDPLLAWLAGIMREEAVTVFERPGET